ncbi:MAG: hypothetical protein ACRESJ_33760 [Pseudomonas sp.]|uniref:hypothetical protein n=1 Tax=Pseudomonas sp. TaxID=306 RepID=UPI003D6FE983
MKNLKRKITNPITVIAIFATLSETSAAVTLPFLDNNEREIYVWFLISFPFYLLLLFFATLNFNYRSLYAPSDYEKGEHFIEVLDDVDDREQSTPTMRLKKAGRDDSPHDRAGAIAPAAQAPPDKTGTSMQHAIRLPDSSKDLHIIDARQGNKPIELSTSLQKTQGKLAHVVLLLADPNSEKTLKSHALKYSKQARKRDNATFLVVYNVNTHGVTVIDQACH